MQQRTFRLGKIDIYFPDSVIKKYWFYADVAALLNQETTEQAVSLIRKELKQRGFGRIAFDSEADGTSVSYRDGQKVFEVAAVINKLHNPSFMVSQELRDSFKEEIANYKIPKGQKYKIGDKIIVPERHNTYFHVMQMIDEYEGSAVCILFNKVYKGMDEAAAAEIGKDLLKEHVFAAVCLQESYIIDYTFKVISSNHEPLARVLYTNRRNRLLDETFPDISIQELFELERNAANSDFMKESRQKLSYLTWIKEGVRSVCKLNTESLTSIGNLDVINLLHYHSLYSSDFMSNNDIITFFEHLDFNQILIEVMGAPGFIEEMISFIEDKQFAVNALSKRLIHVECMLTKEELLERRKLTEYLSFLASINDFVVLIADPVHNKKYFNSVTQKVDVRIESKEKVIWFEFDATDVYVVE